MIAVCLLFGGIVHAQELLHPYEVDVDVEVPTTLRIYNSSGSLLNTFTINPSAASPDWRADFHVPTNCTFCEWHFDWLASGTEFLTFEFKSGGPGLTEQILGRYVYVATGFVYGPGETDFFSPDDYQGSPDVSFKVFDLGGGNAEVKTKGFLTSDYLEDYFSGNFVMPYDHPYFCSQVTCPSPLVEFFIARVNDVPNATTRTFTFASEGSPTYPAAWSGAVWDDPAMVLEFAPLTNLLIQGSLSIEELTLTAADPAAGWSGVYYADNSAGVLRGVTIEKFGYTQGGGSLSAPQVCGLTVNNRWLGVYRSIIQGGINNANGVCSYGSQGQVALRDENEDLTFVRNNNGHGLYAYSRGRIFVRNGRVEGNHGNGGLALGTQARIYANEASSISGNLGVGLEARSDGNIYLYNPNTPSAPTGTIIDGNIGGGLLAQFQGSYINAGTWLGGGSSSQGYCQAACQNFITGHDAAGIPYDVKAASGSFVTAEFDHWGFGRTQESDLVLIEDGTSNIDVLPIWDGIASLREGPVALKSDPEPMAFGSSVRGFIGEAFDKAAEGRWIPAFAKAQAALALAFSEDDLQLAMGAVSVLVSQPDAPDLPLGLLTAIEAHLGAGREARPFALRTLLTADRVHGRVAEGRATAQTLIADYPRTEHALTALALEVSFALEADDLPAAQTALATLEADFQEDVLTEASRAYFVLVAGEDALPTRTAGTPVAASVGVSDVSASTAVDGFALHAAYPNPFNPQTVVPFSVASTARVQITVFDLIGREVATIVSGRYEAGVYNTTFDGALLSSGVYLLRANVTPENGGVASAFTQRLTLLK